MRILYFDCFAGAAGDMIVAALIDAGANLDFIKNQLQKLPLTGYSFEVKQVQKKGISALQFMVNVAVKEQPHRHYSEIKQMLMESDLVPEVKNLSLEIFARLAAAEGKVHGCPPEKVHFHEVGAVDSIVDIVGAAAAIYNLQAEEIFASPLHLGSGTVQTAHGELPVPAPATVELLKDIPVYTRGIKKELVTPTGAAILSTIAQFRPFPPMTISGSGYGAGRRDLPIANVVRVLVGKTGGEEKRLHGTVTVLETTIDDMNPEFYAYISARLRAKGAVDVILTPVYMKKNRPGTQITVLVEAEHEAAVIEQLFAETTTIGVRKSTVEKIMLSRRLLTVQTPYGPVRVKMAEDNGRTVNLSPEYEDCKRLALEHKVPIKTVYAAAMAASLNTV
ncbi:MAG: nickel pincer cofactor biosynthesis protein LarC [Firmicutes bacterium]|mgnify:FL=1|nr:nickel pincer cofactor biosynthesis protein LarC [Bacillota bacterium]